MRKKKWAEPFLEAHSDYALNTGSGYKGHWKEFLHAKALHVEIGMGKGDYLNQMSAMYPEEGWVGIEKDRSAAAVAARKAIEAENADLSNRRMIVGDAAELLEWFAPEEVDVIHLNFSDP